MDILQSKLGRLEAKRQMEHLISILNNEIKDAQKNKESSERSKIVIGNGAIIESLQIGIRAIDSLNDISNRLNGISKSLNME